MSRFAALSVCLSICLVAVFSACTPATADTLVSEDFDSWKQSPDGGWKARASQRGGPPELVSDGRNGKALKVTTGRNDSSYLVYDLGSPRRELYVALRVKIEAADRGRSWEEQGGYISLLQLIGEEGGKTTSRAAMSASLSLRKMFVETFTPIMGVHMTGLPWAIGDTLNLGFGVKYDRQGYVRFYYEGVKVYEANCDTTEGAEISNVRHVRIGAIAKAASTIVLDDVRVATTESEAGVVAGSLTAPPPVLINVDSDKVIRPTNMKCFGIAGTLPAGRDLFTRLKAATKAFGFTSIRWMPSSMFTVQDWDLDIDYPPSYPQPFYYKKRHTSSPVGNTGRSFEEHLDCFDKDAQIACIANVWGGRGSDYQGKKLDGYNGWVQYNLRQGHKDCIYEIGNEMDLPQRSTASYFYTGASWDRLSTGVIDWPPPGPLRVEQSLMHPATGDNGYDYTFPLNTKGAALYLGFRYRWSMCDLRLARAGAGDARLAWAIWTPSGWLTVQSGGAGQTSYLLTEYRPPDENRDLRNLALGNGRVFWSQAFYKRGGPFDQWTSAGINEITSGACPGTERLYYVKVWLESGSYTGAQPQEATIDFIPSPQDYRAVCESFAEIIRRNGGAAYTGSSSPFDYPGWLEMLESLSPMVDGHVFHGYIAKAPDFEIRSSGGPYTPFGAVLYGGEGLRKMADELRARKAFAGKKLAMTEWASPDGGYLGGLGTAIALCEILKGGWDSANRYIWNELSGGKNPSAFLRSRDRGKDTEWFERPSAMAFRLIRRAAGPKLVSAECRRETKTGYEVYPGLYVCAFGGDARTDRALIVINRTEMDFSETPIAWKSAANQRFEVTELHSAEGLKGSNDGDAAQVKDIKRSPVEFDAKGEARINLPPYSMFVLKGTSSGA